MTLLWHPTHGNIHPTSILAQGPLVQGGMGTRGQTVSREWQHWPVYSSCTAFWLDFFSSCLLQTYA